MLAIAPVYASLIRKKLRTLDSVPDVEGLREQVAGLLGEEATA
ncbi:CD1375 family protein [Paenibacillus sp. FSL W8-0426]